MQDASGHVWGPGHYAPVFGTRRRWPTHPFLSARANEYSMGTLEACHVQSVVSSDRWASYASAGGIQAWYVTSHYAHVLDSRRWWSAHLWLSARSNENREACHTPSAGGNLDKRGSNFRATRSGLRRQLGARATPSAERHFWVGGDWLAGSLASHDQCD